MKRRSSEGPDGQHHGNEPVPLNMDQMRQQLRLGPANRAARPLSNKREMFKIKQGLSPGPSSGNDGHASNGGAGGSSRMPPRSVTVAGGPPARTASGDERMPLLAGERRESGDWVNGHSQDRS